MGRLKFSAKKKRMNSRASVRSPPFWAHIRKFGLKRVRTRRIRVSKENNWRRGRKMHV